MPNDLLSELNASLRNIEFLIHRMRRNAQFPTYLVCSTQAIHDQQLFLSKSNETKLFRNFESMLTRSTYRKWNNKLAWLVYKTEVFTSLYKISKNLIHKYLQFNA